MLFLIGIQLQLFYPTKEEQKDPAFGDVIAPQLLFGLVDLTIGVFLGYWPPVEAWIVTTTLCVAAAFLFVVDFFLQREES